MYMWKKFVLVALLSCVATLAVTGGVMYYAIYKPFDVVNAEVETSHFSDDELKEEIKFFGDQKSKGYIDYMHKGFEFDPTAADEYFLATVTVEIRNPSDLTTSALYLIPKEDNDVICYLESYMKAENLLPGETKKVSSHFVCRKNGKTDGELTEFIENLDFYLLEDDNIFGRKKIKVSLKNFG